MQQSQSTFNGSVLVYVLLAHGSLSGALFQFLQSSVVDLHHNGSSQLKLIFISQVTVDSVHLSIVGPVNIERVHCLEVHGGACRVKLARSCHQVVKHLFQLLALLVLLTTEGVNNGFNVDLSSEQVQALHVGDVAVHRSDFLFETFSSSVVGFRQKLFFLLSDGGINFAKTV